MKECTKGSECPSPSALTFLRNFWKKGFIKKERGKKKEMIKAIFFDFDGVLTLDRSGRIVIVKALAEKLGVSDDLVNETYSKYAHAFNISMIKLEHVISGMCAGLGMKIPMKIWDYAVSSARLNEEIFELIKKEYLGKYLLGIITDSSKYRFDLLKKKFKLENMFNVLISSGDVKTDKHGTKIFEIITDKIKMSADEILYIDNDEYHVDMAKKAGFKGIHYDSQEHDIKYLKKEIDKILK